MVHYREYRVETITQRQMRDQVKGDHFKRFRILGHWDSVQRRLSRMGSWLGLLARSASFDIFGNPGPHARPLVVLGHLLICLISAQVPSDWGVVVESQDFSLVFFRWMAWIKGLDERFGGN